jgi:hypothetical protein
MPRILISRRHAAVLLISALVISCSSSRRQKVSVNPKPAEVATAQRTIPKPLPFQVGEVLLYEVEFSKLVLSGTIGQIKFYVLPNQPARAASDDDKRDQHDTRAVALPGTNPPSGIEFKAEAISKGFFTWLFGIKVSDTYESLVNSEDLGLKSSLRTLDEGNVHREQKAVLDRDNGFVTVTETDLANKASPPKVKRGASPRWVQDVLSAIYYLRTQPLKEGQTLTIPISDQAQLYNIEVVPAKTEEVNVGGRKYSATPVDVQIFDGRFVKRSGQLTVWVTDDAARLPVKAKLKISGVTVTMSLTAAKG